MTDDQRVSAIYEHEKKIDSKQFIFSKDYFEPEGTFLTYLDARQPPSFINKCK